MSPFAYTGTNSQHTGDIKWNLGDGFLARFESDVRHGRECTFAPLKIRWCKDPVNQTCEPSECVVLMVFNHRTSKYGIFDPLCHEDVAIRGQFHRASFNNNLISLRFSETSDKFRTYGWNGPDHPSHTKQLQALFNDADRSHAYELSASLTVLVVECAVYMGSSDIWDIGERVARLIVENRDSWSTLRMQLGVWCIQRSKGLCQKRAWTDF